MHYNEKLNHLFTKLKIKADIVDWKIQSPFLIFNLSLHSGGKFKQLERYSTEIALALKAISEPLVYPITKEGVVRMEMMVHEPPIVKYSEYNKNFPGQLPIFLGITRTGDILVPDLVNMPHILVGGTTGAGKSVMLHSIICNLKDRAKLALIDTKRVEFSYYNKNLYKPVAKSVNDGINLLHSLIDEMEIRFHKLEKMGVRNISYSNNMPYIVVIIDELADLMTYSKKEVQDLLCQLAQKSRACGIHIIAATQRPSVDVITGLIKANFPARIACRVASQTDSRVILDCGGAEKLKGNGDAILQSAQHNFIRFQGAYLSEQEIIQMNKPNNWWSNIWNG